MDSNDPEDYLCNATMAIFSKLKLEEQDLHLEKPVKGLERLYRADADRVSWWIMPMGTGSLGKCRI